MRVLHLYNKEKEFSGIHQVVKNLIAEQNKIQGVVCQALSLENVTFKKFLKIFEFRNIVVHGLFNLFTVMAVVINFCHVKKSLIIVAHGQSQKLNLKKKLYWFFLKFLLRKNVSFQFLNEQEYENSQIKWPKYFIQNNGCTARELFLKDFSTPIKLFCISRITKQKGLEEFLNEFTQIDSALKSNFQFNIYGPIMSDCENIKNYFNYDEVIYHGPVYGIEKEQAFKENDIFCIPSIFEGEPIAFYEAASHSKICINSENINIKQKDISNFSYLYRHNIEEILLTILALDSEKIKNKQLHAHNFSTINSWNFIAKKSLEHYKND